MVEGKEQTVEITLIKCQGYYSYNSRFNRYPRGVDLVSYCGMHGVAVGDAVEGRGGNSSSGQVLSKSIRWDGDQYKRLFLVDWESGLQEWLPLKAFTKVSTKLKEEEKEEDDEERIYHIEIEGYEGKEEGEGEEEEIEEIELEEEYEVKLTEAKQIVDKVSCAIERWYRYFFGLCFSCLRFGLLSSFVYIFWISAHYCGSHLYSVHCAPVGLYGFLTSPFLTNTPHCTALRWIIFNGANSINGMWLVLGTWLCTKFLYALRDANASSKPS